MAETRTNPNALKNLAAQLDQLDEVVGKVGWFEGSAYPDGTPVAYVASIQEHGVPSMSIPSRSFFRSTEMEEGEKWRSGAAATSKRILKGEITPAHAMGLLVKQVESDVANKIATITAPPLSKITLGVRKYKQMGKEVTGATIGEIARKIDEGKLDVSGVSDKPLVDTAHMVNTLASKVEGGNG